MSVDCRAVSGFGIYVNKYQIAKFFGLDYKEDDDYDWVEIKDDDYHVDVAGSYISGEIDYYIFIRDCYNPVTILKEVELMKVRLAQVGLNKEVKHYKDTLWY